MLSIIVPLYNKREYLPYALESILLIDCEKEIIVVDDGSTDGSIRIAEKFAANNSCIKIIRQENRGLGPARNTGIEHSNGDCIGFVDPDDWVDPVAYTRLYDQLITSDADVIYFGLYYHYSSEKQIKLSQQLNDCILDTEDSINQYRRIYYGPLPNRLKDEPNPISACTGLFKIDLFKKSNSVRFKNRISEDRLFNIEICKVAKKILISSICGYYYRKEGQSSISNSLDDSKLNELTLLFKDMADLLLCESENNRQECEIRFKRCIIDNIRHLIILANAYSKEDFNYFLDEIFSNHYMKWAISGYPIYKLSLLQQCFLFALWTRWKNGIRWMVSFKK